jgi:ribosomal silencing factor RsfS
VVDAGSVLVHLFKPEIREIYSLEKLWGMDFDIIENQPN